MEKIIKTIAEELNIKEKQVEAAIKLIDEGNTIPFIARYRKEVTGGLSDEILRDLGERLNYLRNLEQRKQEVINSIDEQGKLTDEIVKSVAIAKTLAEVEDIYRPYKQKKKTRATVAKAKGLEPLAEIIIKQEEKTPIEEIAKQYINIDKLSEEDKKNKDKVVATAEEAIQGALDIIAEDISDNAKYRKEIKRLLFREGLIVTKATKEEEKSNYEKKINEITSKTCFILECVDTHDFLTRCNYDLASFALKLLRTNHKLNVSNNKNIPFYYLKHGRNEENNKICGPMVELLPAVISSDSISDENIFTGISISENKNYTFQKEINLLPIINISIDMDDVCEHKNDTIKSCNLKIQK